MRARPPFAPHRSYGNQRDQVRLRVGLRRPPLRRLHRTAGRQTKFLTSPSKKWVSGPAQSFSSISSEPPCPPAAAVSSLTAASATETATFVPRRRVSD